MSIGSFLASAGRIGEGVEQYQTDSSLRRLARAQAEAQQSQLARVEEERRLLQAESTRLAGLLPQEAGVLGINADISQQAGILPAYVEPALVAPPSATAGLTQTPPPAGGGAGAGTKTKKVSPATTKAPRFLQIEGATIQPWDMKRPDRLDTAGVAGFGVVDPNASDASKAIIATRNNYILDTKLQQIALSTGSQFSGIRKPFISQGEKAKLAEREQAANWYQTSDAKDYFRRNPEMLAVAQKNPTNFYGALVENNRRVRESVKAPAAAPATPAPQEVAPAPSTTGVRSAAPRGPAATTKGARDFDAQGKGYEALIQRASAAYGVDATILKRLIASESRFDPNIVNKKSGAIGLAQVMPDHIRNGLVTEEQARDPATAINFAAAHLAQNLRNEGGDYRNALLRYKGALSQKGVDAMSPVVRNIISGLQYDPQAVLSAVGPQLARSRDPATNAALALQQGGGATGGATGVQQAGVSLGAAPKEKRLNLSNINTYLARSDKLPQSVTYVNAQRQFALAKAQAAARTGNIAGYEAAVTQLKEYEGDLTRLMGAQAMVDIQNFNDPRRASQLISYLSGGQLELRMREDGSFAYFGRNAQGQPVILPGRENVGRSDVIETLRRASDEVYRKTRADAEIAAANAAAELAGKIELEQVKGQIQGEIEQFKGGVDLNKAIIQARAQLAAARLRGQNTASVAVGDENWVTYNDPNTGEQLLARPTEVTLPSGQTTVTLDAKPLSQWGGGAQ